jgi:hypothetical protein
MSQAPNPAVERGPARKVAQAAHFYKGFPIFVKHKPIVVESRSD